MSREDLRAMGLTEEQVNSIMAMNGKSIQSVQSQLASAQANYTKLSSDFDAMKEKYKNVEIPKEISPEMKALQEQVEQLKAEARVKDLRAYLNGKSISGDNAEAIINAFGSDFDKATVAIDMIAKLISDTTETTKKETEKSLMQSTPNPQGVGNSGSDNNSKPDDVKNAESIVFASKGSNAQSAQDYYK